MKTRFTFAVVLMSLLAGSVVLAQVPEKKGHWKFDDASNLEKATSISNLTFEGTLASVDGPVTGNLAVEVKMGEYITVTHGIDANGGGDSVNVYSLMFDISMPESSLWHAIFQTNIENATDASMFLNTSNLIGAWRYGYSELAMEAATWYRVIVSVENGVSYNVYVDGEIWVAGVFQEVDSRDALAESILFFADNDGEDNTMQCSEIAIWDVALTADEAAELGDATTVGVHDKLKANLSNDLDQNYPNPFATVTTLNYNVVESGDVSFMVFNAIGQKVQEINAGNRMAGDYQLELNAGNLNNGIYYVQMKNNNRVSNRKITVSK